MALDLLLLYLLNNAAGQAPALDALIVFCASYIPYLVVAALIVLLFFSAHPKWLKWRMLLTALISGLVARYGVTELIRYFYHRPRPFSILPVHDLLVDTAWSFPSGHASFFFALAMAVYLYDKRWGIWFFVAALVISAARVAAGVHYPTDILGGAAVGIATAWAVYFLAQRIRPVRI